MFCKSRGHGLHEWVMVEGQKAISFATTCSSYMFVFVALLYVTLVIFLCLQFPQNKKN